MDTKVSIADLRFAVVIAAKRLDQAMGNASGSLSAFYGEGHAERVAKDLEISKKELREAVAALRKGEGDLQYAEDSVLRAAGKDVCGYCHAVEPGRYGYECAQCGGV
jgi:hypothetical protein